jgi:hypothetical protein
MSVFRDSNGDEWRVYLDAFTLADIKKECGIDLADITAGGWHAVATDASAVGRVLAVVCQDEIKARKSNGRQFAKLIRGEAIEAGRKALTDEGADFFPASEWSAIRSNSLKRTKAASQAEAMRMGPSAMEMATMADAIGRLPESVLLALVKAGGDTSSLTSEDNESVPGPIATPLRPATGSPESADLAAVG